MARKHYEFGLCTVLVLVIPSARGDALLPVEQERRVSGFAIVPQCQGSGTDLDEAVDFGPFAGFAERIFSCAMAHGNASATQDSQITSSSLVGLGSSLSDAAAGVPNAIHAIAGSVFDVTFEVPLRGTFKLEGQLGVESTHPTVVIATSFISFNDVDGAVLLSESVTAQMAGVPEEHMVGIDGILTPREYRLQARAQTFLDATVPPVRMAEAAFEFNFRIANGDSDSDLDVDLADHAELIPCLAGPGVACDIEYGPVDFDFDGDVDLADFRQFQDFFAP